VDDWSTSDTLLRLLLGAAAIAVVYWLLLGRRADFVIRVRGRRVECKGKVPLARQRLVADFLLNDLALREAVQISGARSGSRLHLWFRGRLSEGQKQRIRNFLVMQL
jgi:hypothetical protein